MWFLGWWCDFQGNDMKVNPKLVEVLMGLIVGSYFIIT